MECKESDMDVPTQKILAILAILLNCKDVAVLTSDGMGTVRLLTHHSGDQRADTPAITEASQAYLAESVQANEVVHASTLQNRALEVQSSATARGFIVVNNRTIPWPP